MRPVEVFGPGHDGKAVVELAKAGSLPPDGVIYLGAGDGFDRDGLSALRPDAVVDVTYDDEALYALPGAVAESLWAAGVPVIALSVGEAGADFAGILRRFAALAAALGAGPQALAQAARKRELTAAEDALRSATARRTVPMRALALSVEGPRPGVRGASADLARAASPGGPRRPTDRSSRGHGGELGLDEPGTGRLVGRRPDPGGQPGQRDPATRTRNIARLAHPHRRGRRGGVEPRDPVQPRRPCLLLPGRGCSGHRLSIGLRRRWARGITLATRCAMTSSVRTSRFVRAMGNLPRGLELKSSSIR